MNVPPLNPYYRSAIALVVMAGVLIAVAITTNRNDFISAVLVVAGLVCLLTGIIFTTLSGNDPLDLRYVCLLPVQGSINLVRICADMGIQGNACFIPNQRGGTNSTMQYQPVATYHGEPLSQDSFVTGKDTAGLLITPSCAALLTLLREKDHLKIPSEMAALQELVRELGVDVLEVATRIHSTHEGDIITVTLEEYRLIGGCRAMFHESPRCCAIVPCPVCSLYATIFAEGTGKVIQMEHCSPDPKQPTVTAVFTVLHG